MPLWLLFIAVQLVDVAWAVLVLLGVEKARIVPGITASNPLDLYYMPYTHSLVAAGLWSVATGALVRPMRNPKVLEAFENFVTLEQELLALLRKRVEQDRKMLSGVGGSGGDATRVDES
jgi:hypothetical protein